MLNFEFLNPTKIIFGKGSHKQVGQQVAQYSHNVLLHYGGTFLKSSGVLTEITTSLKQAGITYTELPGVVPNPRLSLVHQGVALCREKNIDFILAVGGGSVIDSAKAIAAGVPYTGDVWDFYSSDKRPETMLPVGVVLTIPAAGSESSDGTVITNQQGPYKRSFVSPLAFPKFAMLNPELCYTLPANQIAAGGADILAHVMERYFSRTPNTDMSDRLCEGTMKAIMSNVPKALQNPQNYDTWAEVMWAGNVAHNGLLGKGKQEDWASHAIEHEVSAQYDIAHGAGLAIIFPAWMKYVYQEDTSRFVQFAVRVLGVDLPYQNPDAIALEGIRRVEAFFKSLGLATTFTQAGIGDEHFALMAERACGNGTQGSFKKLNKQDVMAIFELAK
ncbi:iron-containing alcohol dehydrogenase [Ruminococcaceae bacterium OttesenSCG-928-A16]|nr:iron-containing alcohol dehydrogenase [Ruminococcaceae bacterium OttesenSCG-928-A16]